MPIEIKELHIKVTVRPPSNQDAAAGADMFLFNAVLPAGSDGTLADWPGPTLTEDLAPAPAPVDAAAAVRHAGGINVMMGDGSVRSVPDGFDLFG